MAEAALADGDDGVTLWPKLDRLDYYCKPGTDELRGLSNDQLARLSGFELGRHGYGSILWTEEVDVRGLDLDELVQIERNYVRVRDDVRNPFGNGLDRPAMVTLTSLWGAQPPARVVEIAEDPGAIGDALQSQCASQGARLVHWDPRSRSVEFEVPHFSRYGFFDDSDDEEQQPSGVAAQHPAASDVGSGSEWRQLRPTAEASQAKSATPSRILSVPEDFSDVEDDAGDSKMEDMPSGQEEEMDTDTGRANSSALFRSLEVPKLQRMQRLFFSQDRNLAESTVSGTGAPSSITESTLTSEIDDESGKRPKISQATSLGPAAAKVPSLSMSILSRVVRQADSAGDPSRFAARPFPRLEDSVVPDAERACRDPLLALGRSFRVSFRGAGQTASVILPQKAGDTFKVCIVSPQHSTDRDYYEPAMKLHMGAWTQDTSAMSSTSSPAQPTLENVFGVDVATRDESLNEFISIFAKEQDRHLEIIFRALVALYSEQKSMREEVLRRRISAWLSDFACPWSQSDSSAANYLQQSYFLMSSGNLDDAADAMLANNAWRLALLVGRAMEFPGTTYHRDVKAYSDEYSQGAGDALRDDMKDVLRVLSGQVSGSRGLSKLSWYRALAMFLWFSDQGRVDLSLRGALENFERAWKSDGVAPPPVPPYQSAEKWSTRTSAAQQGDYDAVYCVLCLFANIDLENKLEKAFSNTSIGESRNPWDFRGSWCLFQCLQGIVGAGAGIRRESRLHAAFSQQLEAAGLPLWAVYVMACCPSDAERDTYLRSLVLRTWPELCKDSNATKDGIMEARQFLTGQLGIPSSWLEEAAALWARYRGKHAETVEALCRLSDLEETPAARAEAQALLCDEITPRVVSLLVRRVPEWRKGALRTLGLLTRLAPHSLPSWDTRGCVIKTFLTLLVDEDDKRRSSLWNSTTSLHSFMISVSRFSVEASPLLRTPQCGKNYEFLRLVMANFGTSLERRLYLKKVANDGPEQAAAWGEVARSDLISVKLSVSHGIQIAGEYAGDDRLGVDTGRLWSVPLAPRFGVPIGL